MKHISSIFLIISFDNLFNFFLNNPFLDNCFLTFEENGKNLLESIKFLLLIEISGVSLKLSKSQVSKLKNKYNEEHIFLDLKQLLEKIRFSIPDLYIEITDYNYDIKIKNNNAKK